MYCCCVGEKPDEVQAERFERSSWYRLTDVAEFATRVKILLRDQLKIAQEIVIVRGPVNYVDNKGVIVTPSTRHLITPHEKILPVNLLFEKPVQFAPETEYRFMWMVMISDGVVGEVGGNDYFDLAGLDTADIIEFPTDV